MKSQMTIGTKLFLSFGAALALTLIVGFVSLQNIASLGASEHTVITEDARAAVLAGDINTAQAEFMAAERGIIRRMEIKDKATAEKYNQNFQESAARYQKDISELTPLVNLPEERALVGELQIAFRKITSAHQEFMSLVRSDNVTAADALFNDTVLPVLNEADPIPDKLVEVESVNMATLAKEADASVLRSRWITIIMIVFSFVVALVVVFVVRQINRSLRQTVTDLSEGAEQTASAASQVSASSQSLAQGSSEQAASLEETSASSEEINSMARKNTENSRSAADLVTQSQQKFVQTNQALQQTVVAMGEINAQSSKISKIIKVIDEIAFQTNILALNAAVEAARAGEAGMGFAVVADEVRNLAQRCAQAAKDTAALIEESIAKSNDGKTKVDQVATAIRAITEETSAVKTLVDEVNLGSQEQARGIEQVGKAIVQMEQVTQKTAANAEESAAAAEELTAQSDTLKAIVERLTAMVGGGESGGGSYADSSRKGAASTRHAAARKPQRHLESASDLSALRAAVAHKPKGHAAEPVLAGAKADKKSFPMDDDFKEF